MCELAARKSKKKGNTKLFKHWSHVLQKLRQNRRVDINCVQLVVLFSILTRRRGINTLLHICIYKKMRAALKIISFNGFSHLKVLRVGHKFNWYLDAWCFSFLFWIFFFISSGFGDGNWLSFARTSNAIEWKSYWDSDRLVLGFWENKIG